MGFWSSCWNAVKSACSTVKNAVVSTVKTVTNTVKKVAKKTAEVVKEVVSHPVESIKKGVEKVWSGTKKIWDNISGNKAKEISEKARKIYDDARAEYDKAVALYEKEMEVLNRELCDVLDSINSKKEYIIDVLFVKMQNILSKIKYEKRFAVEYLDTSKLKVTKISLRTDVLKIDFKKNPIKSRLKAWLTLGIWANKEANESLDEAENEKKKMLDAQSRMKSELSRYQLMKKALVQTLGYLTEMVEIYEAILFKSNSAANYLRFKCIQFTHGISEQYCKLSALPEADQNLLYSLFNLSVILNAVAKMHIVGESTEQEIKNYSEDLEKQHTAYLKAA